MTDDKRVNDYVSRKSKETGQHWGKKLITLPDDLHGKMVEEAQNLRIPMYEAYIQAARLWLKQRGITGVLGDKMLTGDEEAFMNRVLHIYRNRKEHNGCADAFEIMDKVMKLVKPQSL